MLQPAEHVEQLGLLFFELGVVGLDLDPEPGRQHQAKLGKHPDEAPRLVVVDHRRVLFRHPNERGSIGQPGQLDPVAVLGLPGGGGGIIAQIDREGEAGGGRVLLRIAQVGESGEQVAGTVSLLEGRP
jgi:hypothetical protein